MPHSPPSLQSQTHLVTEANPRACHSWAEALRLGLEWQGELNPQLAAQLDDVSYKVVGG